VAGRVLRALVHHVLEQVSEAAAVLRFVLGADVIPKIHMNPGYAMIDGKNDLQSIREGVFSKERCGAASAWVASVAGDWEKIVYALLAQEARGASNISPKRFRRRTGMRQRLPISRYLVCLTNIRTVRSSWTRFHAALADDFDGLTKARRNLRYLIGM